MYDAVNATAARSPTYILGAVVNTKNVPTKISETQTDA
jgi:hypothetical protein